MKNNLVIGSGANGIFITLNLLEKGENVELVTENKITDSVSYFYGLGITNNQILRIKNLDYLKYTKLNSIFDIIWFIFLYLFSFVEDKNYIINKSFEILKKYNIEPKKCNKSYLLYAHSFIDKIVNDEFTKYKNQLIIKENTKVDLSTLDNIKNKYKTIYVCVGGGKHHDYTKPIYGFKMLVKSKTYPDCLYNDSGILISKQTFKKNNNMNIPEGDYLNIEGGSIILKDNTLYHSLQKNDYYGLNKKLETKEFWTKYGCEKIMYNYIGKRMISKDYYPFFYYNDNICYIEGGGYMGVIISPVISKYIVYNIKDPFFDFSINRIKRKICNYNILFMIILIILYVINKKY